VITVTNKKARIIDKIITDRNGRLFRAYFLIVERGGKFYGKLIRVEPIANRIENVESRIKKNKIIYLPVFCSPNSLTANSYKLQAIFSPYFLNTFFTSQMTRAPSK